jgi:archaeal flagellin FlaB
MTSSKYIIMAELDNKFVELMIKKSNEKEEKPTSYRMLIPEKSQESEPQRQMTDKEIRSVEEFTLELQKRIQTKKGEIGIGVLIIFLALLVIAAIVATVIITSSGIMQEKTIDTGSSAHGTVGTLVKVISISAEDGRQGEIINFSMIVKPISGSQPIKLDQAIITFDTLNTTTLLRYKNSTASDYATDSSEGNFTTTYLERGPINQEGVFQKGDILEIFFSSPYPINEDEKIRVSFLPKEGAQTIAEFSTPNVISKKIINLYP